VLALLLMLGVALWLACLVWNVHNSRETPVVTATMTFALREHPRVSILIPARNEAAILAMTLPAFLAQDYDNYEVILADDASTDGTGELAQSFAARHPGRLRVIRIEGLPPGWIGKAHALHRAFEAADGDWVLATDADVVFHPKALRAGLWLAERQQAELVSIFAFLECGSFWEKLMMPVFGLMLASVFPLRKINDPQSSVALASGGYILMRRETWAGLGGYEVIRGEMIDDLNTARRVKHSGRRIFVAVTRSLLRTRMYESFSEMWEGLTKNAFAAHRYSAIRSLTLIAGIWFTTLLPLVALVWTTFWRAMPAGEQSPGMDLVFVLALAQYFLSAALHSVLIAFYGIPWGYALLAPLGSLLYTAIALDSMLRTLLGKGVSWKLRVYGRPSGGAKK
jgi:hopene-associated glycosyltransferase HpnB